MSATIKPVDRVGHVYLVGAGPGDPGLLTRRGAELLAIADIVVHDRLVSDEVLELVAPTAELIDVGKTPRTSRRDPAVQPSSMPTQEAINDLLVDGARRSRVVIRLKGGDPFVFGRGWEELAACRAAGVPCEVVPGVSSAIAGPAAAGIPVTARGVARSFAVITARGGDGQAPCETDFAALARIDTVVALMGRDRLDEIATGLLAAQRDPDTPAAVVERATLPGQRTVTATLSTIAAAADDAGIGTPAILVIGAVVGLAPTIADAVSAGRDGPLHGRRVLVTRPVSAARDLCAALRARGAEPIECPLISIDYPPPPPLSALLPGPSQFDWLVVTSLHGARGLARALDAAKLDGRAFGGTRIAAVGPKTAAELWSTCRLRADLVPGEHRAAALVDALADAVRPGDRVLFACGTLARDEVATGLRAVGTEVVELVVYRTVPCAPRPDALRGQLDAVLLYSPSAARSLHEHRVDIGGAVLVCVGPTTAAAAGSLGLGLGPTIVPDVYGDAGVIAALEAHFAAPVSPQEEALT